MEYFITKVVKSLLKNYNIYIFVIIETVIAMIILGIGINITLSFRNKLDDIETESSKALHQFNTSWSSGKDNVLYIERDDYLYCKENFSRGNEVQYIYVITEFVSYYDENEISNFLLLFVSDEFYTYYLNTDKVTVDTIYAGENFIKWQDKSKVMLMRGNRSIDYFKGRNIENIDVLETKTTSFSPYGITGYEIPIEEWVIIPVDQYYVIDGSNPYGQLFMKADTKYIDEASNMVVQYLNNRTNVNDTMDESPQIDDIQFSISNETDNFIRISKSTIEKYKVAITYTMVALVIIIFGLGGILSLLVEKRKKEYGIAIMLGASAKQLMLELFTEIVLVMWLSTGIALTLSSLIMKLESVELFQVVYHYESILICLAITLIISILGCIVPCIMLHHLSPIQILKRVD